MEKSILEMVGGVKHINPHYDIKAESSSCYNINEGFTGIEVNGIRFSNIGEMLCYMNKQREQLIKAKDLITKLSKLKHRADDCFAYDEYLKLIKEAKQFLKETNE